MSEKAITEIVIKRSFSGLIRLFLRFSYFVWLLIFVQYARIFEFSQFALILHLPYVISSGNFLFCLPVFQPMLKNNDFPGVFIRNKRSLLGNWINVIIAVILGNLDVKFSYKNVKYSLYSLQYYFELHKQMCTIFYSKNLLTKKTHFFSGIFKFAIKKVRSRESPYQSQAMDLKHTTGSTTGNTETCVTFTPSKSSDYIKPKDQNINIEAQKQG